VAHAGDVIELTPRERLVLITTTAESNGELLAMQAHYGPAGRPPPEHYHPRQEERFTGVGGTVTARVDGIERTIGPGDQLTIPAGVNHAFWNPGGEEAVLRWEVRPALRTERLFEDLAAAGSTLRAAFVVPRYREEFRLSSALQRTLLDFLAPGARVIGLAR
jgi:quercetin dioxygenase-like cupin family protein